VEDRSDDSDDSDDMDGLLVRLTAPEISFLRISQQLCSLKTEQPSALDHSHDEPNEVMAAWALDGWHRKQRHIEELQQEGAALAERIGKQRAYQLAGLAICSRFGLAKRLWEPR